jgi:hypothetical protein
MVFAGTAPAADPALVNLVMPDATVIAGVNVAQAKATPFGQYVLTLIAPHDQQLQLLAVATGFDPRQDVNELLVATNGPAGSEIGLALARGAFNVSAITTAATLVGSKSETYQGVVILESPDGTKGFAFPTSTLAVVGDVPSVKSAIDRQSSGAQHLSSTVVSEINQLSGANDAWVLTTVPLSSLHTNNVMPSINGLNGQALQQVQQANAAVKFGVNVTVTAQAQLDTAQNATTLAGMLQLLASMAQMQAQKAPEAAALAKSVTATAAGSTVTVTFSMPQAQIQQLVQTQQNKVSKIPQKKQ